MWNNPAADATKRTAEPGIIDIWLVEETINESGHTGEFIGAFLHEAPARAAAKGKGWYGGDAAVTKRRAVAGVSPSGTACVLDREYDQPVKVDPTNDIIKRQALAKLTDDERRALGL